MGYLLTDRVSDLDEFAAAIRRVGQGGSAIDRRSSRSCSVASVPTIHCNDSPPREREVLELMAQGRTNHAIAERLVITPRAVEKHVSRIFDKLGLPDTADDHRRVLAVVTLLQS